MYYRTTGDFVCDNEECDAKLTMDEIVYKKQKKEIEITFCKAGMFVDTYYLKCNKCGREFVERC